MTTTTSIKKVPTGELVGTGHVENLVRGYKQQRWIFNSERLGKPDSLSTWYGLDELSSFLELAREHQADGIKMFYGVYPDDYARQPLYAGRQTVVLVATRKKDTEFGIVNKHIYHNVNGESQILAFNYGDVCPPMCTTKPPGNDGWSLDIENMALTIIDHNGEIKIA